RATPGGNSGRNPRDVVEARAAQDRCRDAGPEPGRADRDDRVVAGQLVEPIRERAGRDVDAVGDVERLVFVRLADIDHEGPVSRSRMVEPVGELVDVQTSGRLDRSAAVRPGPEPAPEMADDLALGADPERLADRLVPV